MKKLFILLALISTNVYTAPFLVSDPYPGKLTLTYSNGTKTDVDITHCGITMDSGSKIDIAITTNATGGKFCKYDLGSLSGGQHIAKARFILVHPDLTGGRVEGLDTPNFIFSITATADPAIPSGLGIIP